jgi:hypothetical protein
MTNKLEGYTKFSEVEENKLELDWVKKISKLLVGTKIVKIQYMTKKDAEEHFLLAEQFQPERNEHLIYLCIFLENEGRQYDMMQYIDKMLQPERVNPFPNLIFLIENRAYYNTGTFLIELRQRISAKMSEHIIDLDSFKADFT